MNQDIIIHATEIVKIYGRGREAFKVLDGISLEVKKGEILSIVGPSGAGKSTLLNMLGCIDTIDSGQIVMLGHDISGLSSDTLSDFRNRHIGFIFQLHNLLPEFTAIENIMMPLLIRRVKWSKAKKLGLELLERFNLSDRADYKPAELSGGECQRIAVSRAIAGNPEIILADEPTGNLDSVNSRILSDILLELGREYNTTIIIATHDMNLASLTKRTIMLKDGKIIA